jgi:hypothetical protein
MKKLILKKLVLYYFYTFLFIDLLNGFIIRYLGLSPVLSPGQLARGVLTIMLLIVLVYRNRITKQNKYIYMFILFFPAALCTYIARDGILSKIVPEVISFSKPLFFLLLLHFVYLHRTYYNRNLDKIIFCNLFIYSVPIFFSSITGIGLSPYDSFYSATKSFFYGNNVTSIIGFILSIYYAYKFRTGKINYLYFSFAFTALYFSGGKIILAVPLLTLLIYMFTGNTNKLKNIVTALILFFISTLFIIGALNTEIFINNSFTQKYFSRTFHEALRNYERRDEINIIPLKWYSYASVTRASRANVAINQIFSNPESIFFGYGVFKGTNNTASHYTAEMDMVDMFYYYGLIGFLLIYIPIFKIIVPLLIRRNINMRTMMIYLIFLYSCLAGHVLTTPTAGSLFALFLGICGSERNYKPSKLGFS